MKPCVRRLALGLGMVWALGLGRASAQGPTLPQPVGPGAKPDAIMPAVPAAGQVAPPAASSGQVDAGVLGSTEMGGMGSSATEGSEFATQRRLRNLREASLNRHGYHCGVDPYNPSCGNCRQELRFIFGSCRTFFGESCLPRSYGPVLQVGGVSGASGASGCPSCILRN